MPKHLIDIMLSAEAREAASSKSFVLGVRNATGNDPAEIAIYGEVGSEWQATDARTVGQFLRDNKGKAVNVRINSPGGLAYDGITIHNALIHHDGPVKTIIEGLAGSAASIIAMAGSPVTMYENASLMIHRASVIAIGNVDMMNEAADWLGRLDDGIAKTYKAKTGKPLDKITAWMRGKVDGTVFTAKEALDNNFIDKIVPLKQDKSKNLASLMRPEADSRLKSVMESRLERMRLRAGDFQPAE